MTEILKVQRLIDHLPNLVEIGAATKVPDWWRDDIVVYIGDTKVPALSWRKMIQTEDHGPIVVGKKVVITKQRLMLRWDHNSGPGKENACQVLWQFLGQDAEYITLLSGDFVHMLNEFENPELLGPTLLRQVAAEIQTRGESWSVFN